MEINSFFLDLIPYLIPLLMIGIGSALDIESFKNLLTNSKSSLVGFLIQVTLLPIVGIATSFFIDNQSIAIGIIVIMCAPGGHISSMYSSLMKGNVAIKTSLTIVNQLNGCTNSAIATVIENTQKPSLSATGGTLTCIPFL